MWPTSRFRFALASVATAALLFHAANANNSTEQATGSATEAAEDSGPTVNGWYPCAFSTETDASYANVTLFECAEVEVPLCYEGVCESDRTIDLFVKRRLAKAEPKDPNAPRKALISLQGGPGYSGVAMEGKMIGVEDETIDYYTFDHRGTGRSEFLECDAAQALTAGSPDGTTLSIEELSACLKDVSTKYHGQAAAFSTTSAAMDVRTMIDTFMADQKVFVAGYSYGSFLAQRILQLEIPQIHGYIFDGVDVLTVKGDKLEGANSHWNLAIQASARRLLEYCFDDASCPIKFEKRETVLEEMVKFIDGMDAQVATNECVKVFASEDGQKPSSVFRVWGNTLITSTADRSKVLHALGHLQRCNKDDVIALQNMSQAAEAAEKKKKLHAKKLRAKRLHAKKHHGKKKNMRAGSPTPDIMDGQSELLYNVVVNSERMSDPVPLLAETEKFFTGGIVGGETKTPILQYCMYTGSKEPACQEVSKDLPQGEHATFSYKHDEYYDKPMALPAHASALIVNGGLDFQTPKEFGELLNEKLTAAGTGRGVLMVNFDYGNHCAGENVAGSEGSPCRDAILSAFVAHDGDVEAVDTSCMEKLPSLSFA